MASAQAVSDQITSAFSNLPRSQKLVARFVVDNQYFVAFASVAEVAQKAGVSAATVVRFCQTLGYEGYPHLQAAIRQGFSRFMTTAQRLEERLTAPVSEDDVLAQAFSTDINNIKYTMELIDPVTFRAAVDEISRAAAILVVGGGISAPPALFLSHSLQVIGFPVRVVTSGGIPLSLELSALKPGDLLICIGFWRYFREAVATMRWAREVGVTRIAITDSEVSPLAQLADYAFVTTTDSIGHSVSPLASIALVDAFVAALSFRRPEKTLAALRKVDMAYNESNLLLEG